jgi:spore germination protein YaaH
MCGKGVVYNTSMKKFVIIALLVLPHFVLASNMEISGWVPYWKAKEGTQDARRHLDVLTEINPFTLSASNDGKIKDLGGMKKSNWKNLFKQARKEGVEIIPTIMWSNSERIHAMLSDPKKRKKHIEGIVKLVKKEKYDGIDIDYEGKKLATKPYFSAFLTELSRMLGDKTLACTIEARTPSDSLNSSGNTIAYEVNDFSVIGDVCDQVRIMTYDQQRADARLNNEKSGAPYIPVGDIDWVEKVARLTIETIPRDKVMLGVATYGREWEVTVTPNYYGKYTSLWSVTHDYSEDFAEQLDITPLRNSAGEKSFTYISTSSPYAKVLKPFKAPAGTPKANQAAAQALAYANATGNPAFFNVVWWSDAEAIKSKLDLAESLGLRGVSIFKIDGTEDKELWNLLSD